MSHAEAPLEVGAFFRRDWPTMAARISATLSRHGASKQDREDVLQETALRLYRAWQTIDQSRGVEPFARTVALNVWRDSRRRAAFVHEVVGDLPEVAGPDDVERIGVARDELRRVRAALARLRPREQSVLRDAAAAAFSDEVAESPPAVRMARMRARRQLAAALRTASVLGGLVGALRGRLRPLRPATADSISTLAVALLMFLPGPDGRGGGSASGPAALDDARSIATAAVRDLPHRVSNSVPNLPMARGAVRAQPRADEPPARIQVPGVGEATVYFSADIAGRRVQVRDRGDMLPVCVDAAPLPTGSDLSC